MYKSHFEPSASGERILRSGNIIDDGELPREMVERVASSLYVNDLEYTGNSESSSRFIDRLGEYMDNGDIVMSTPILTNAGKYIDRPLAACTVPTVSMLESNKDLIAHEINILHRQGMGTGFDLNSLGNPVEMLEFLNEVAISGHDSGLEDRPVGNMAVLSVYHPKIKEFIYSKIETQRHWKFNISIDIDDQFMRSLSLGSTVTLWDGSIISSRELFDDICSAASSSGDPGVVFLDRMNSRNPVPSLGKYKTTAPCAEVGLVKGETCQFGYINIARFVYLRDGVPAIDAEGLAEASSVVTRSLDNALDITRRGLTSDTSRNILDYKRKIGVGICGVADALTLMHTPYDSQEGRNLIRDILSVINYSSKEESIKLAERRGSCLSMNGSVFNRHTDENPPLIESLYAGQESGLIDHASWRCLARRVKKTRTLRNVSTVALPPTGRSALIIDASTGVEPHFSLNYVNESVRRSIDEMRLLISDDKIDKVLQVSRDINPMGHIAMVASLQGFCDESISKTINMPVGSGTSEVAEIYQAAYDSGMSGVTVYVDGTHNLQPKQLH